MELFYPRELSTRSKCLPEELQDGGSVTVTLINAIICAGFLGPFLFILCTNTHPKLGIWRQAGSVALFLLSTGPKNLIDLSCAGLLI